MKKILSTLLLTAALAACHATPGGYVSRGQPESLLDASSERVSFGISAPNMGQELAQWISNDQPTRAELSCMDEQSAGCREAKETLAQFGLHHTMAAGPARDTVVLIYDRVVARDCENRYVDNRGPFMANKRLNHPTFGCSTAANIVQMAGNPQQFTNPPMMDPQDAERPARLFHRYMHGGKKPRHWPHKFRHTE